MCVISGENPQPLGPKKSHATTWGKKARNLSGQKKSLNLPGQQKSRNLSGQKQITQPLGTKTNQANSQDKKKSYYL